MLIFLKKHSKFIEENIKNTKWKVQNGKRFLYHFITEKELISIIHKQLLKLVRKMNEGYIYTIHRGIDLNNKYVEICHTYLINRKCKLKW